MVSARHSIARWLTQAGRLVAILYHSISPHQKETEEMPLEPTKHVNGSRATRTADRLEAARHFRMAS